VLKFARQEKLFRRTQNVLVALSGGPDSVAALLVLMELRSEFGFQLTAAHFDHQLRPESADDLRWVRQLCGSLGVPCLTGEGDVALSSAEQRRGIEETARRMRYQFLAFVAGEKRAECIATGHTSNDQAETVLQHIIRGSGVRGIRGMLPSAPVPGAEAQTLVRPLLCLDREETLEVCRAADIDPLRDPSNDSLAFTRNRVRSQILPLLEGVNPSVRQALVGLAESARELFGPVEQQALSVQPAERSAFGSIVPLSMVARLPSEALTLLVEREASFHAIEFEVNRTRLRNAGVVLRRGSGLVLFGAVALEVSCGLVRIGPELPHDKEVEPLVLNVPGATTFAAGRVIVSTDPLAPNAGGVDIRIDPAQSRGVLRIRSLQPGDRVRRGRSDRKINDVFSSRKVPTWERRGLLGIVDSRHVLGLFGRANSIFPPVESTGPLYMRFIARRP
jgi:tRNA(Ile)-lysidine synthase